MTTERLKAEVRKLIDAGMFDSAIVDAVREVIAEVTVEERREAMKDALAAGATA